MCLCVVVAYFFYFFTRDSALGKNVSTSCEIVRGRGGGGEGTGGGGGGREGEDRESSRVNVLSRCLTNTGAPPVDAHYYGTPARILYKYRYILGSSRKAILPVGGKKSWETNTLTVSNFDFCVCFFFFILHF